MQVSNDGGLILECITGAGIYELNYIQILWYEWRYWRNDEGPCKTYQNTKKMILYTYCCMPTVWVCKLIGNIIIQNKATEGYVFNV